MRDLSKAMETINRAESGWEQRPVLSFAEFLQELIEQPTWIMRNVYQVYHDMIRTFITAENEEYPDDPESIGYLNYDCSKLFAEN